MVREKRSRDSVVSRSPKKKAKEVWWSIKDIIDEDTHQYLVKWEPDPSTGKEYPASWVSKADVTETAVEEWEQYQQRRLKPLTETGRGSNQPQLHFHPSGGPEVGTQGQDHQPGRDLFQAIVEIPHDSQFPREDYPTQVWPPSQPTPTQKSAGTESWHPSPQESSLPFVLQPAPILSRQFSDPLSPVVISSQSDSTASSLPGSSQTTDSGFIASPVFIADNSQPSPSLGHSEPLVSPLNLQPEAPIFRQPDPSDPIYPEPELSVVPDSLQAKRTHRLASVDSVQESPIPDIHSGPRSTQSIMTTPSSSGRFNAAPSPPMQDRVRSIRNSALSSQPRRQNGDSHAAVSSRASSVASEATATLLSDARLDVRTADIAAPYHTMDSPPEDSVDTSVTSSKHELTLPSSGERERFVSLPLPSRVRDQYCQTIQYFRKDIMAFLAGAADEKTTQAMRQLVQRLNNVGTHVDLENEPSQTQHEVPAQDEAKWALSSSSKFVFLQSLLHQLRRQKMHIAIVAGQPRLRELLARFLDGIDVNYTRADGSNQSRQEPTKDSLKVTIVSGAEQDAHGIEYADALLMLDGDVSLEAPVIRTLRSSAQRAGLSPVIHPIVYCSAEHLSRCIERMDEISSEDDKLRALITSIDERQAEVGGVADDEYGPDAAGEEVAYSIVPGPTYLRWTVPQVRPVKAIGLEHLMSKSQQAEDDSADDAGQVREDTPNARKRPYEDDPSGDTDQAKRQRLTPAPEAGRTSEGGAAAAAAESQLRELRQALDTSEKALADGNARVEALEATIRERDEALKDYRRAMDDLQARYERTKRGQQSLRAEHNDLMQRWEAAAKQVEAAKAGGDKARGDVKGLEAELEAARAQLASSSVPSVAEAERLRQSGRELAAAKEALERRMESVRQDFDFTREQYQKASSAAAESAARVTQLEEDMARLQQKASGEAARLREMTDRSESETHLHQLARLRLENDELKEQLRRKERGRGMTTRTGSVAPRSPRLGASPGRSRAGSRAPGSRPSSPVRSLFGARKGRNLVEQAM